MINNFAAARPQSGLTNADVIWEVLAEGGITRLIAVFQSTDAVTDSIGPIRSIRPYLLILAIATGLLWPMRARAMTAMIFCSIKASLIWMKSRMRAAISGEARSGRRRIICIRAWRSCGGSREEEIPLRMMPFLPYTFADTGSTETGVPATEYYDFIFDAKL